MMRNERNDHELRPWSFEPGFTPYAEGSILVSAGNTKVLVNATVDSKIPRWMQEEDGGWVTAEYAMLPRATHTRGRRDINRTNGRASEIQRLIGRSLRMACDLKQLGPCKIILDCDVLQADAGTRTAAISGGWLALNLACQHRLQQDPSLSWPIRHQIAAVSLGLVEERVLLDLDYPEDSNAQVDCNLVMTSKGDIVELQTTGEKEPLGRDQLDKILEVGWEGLKEIFRLQNLVLEKMELPNR